MRLAIVLLSTFLFTTHLFAQQSLVFQPQKPHPNERLTILYNTRATPMLGENDIEATAYLLSNNQLPIARDIILKKVNGQYRGTIQTNDTTKAVFVSFRKDEKRDNNSGKGYYTFLYDKKGMPVTGAKMATGYAFMGNGGLWGLDRNTDLGDQLMKAEFKEHPKELDKFKNDYLSMLARSRSEESRTLLRGRLDQMTAVSNPSEEDLSLARMYYERTLKDSLKAGLIKAQLQKTYPGGNWMKTEQLTSFYREKAPQKKEAIYEALVSTFPARGESDQNSYDYLAANLALDFAVAGNIQKSEQYLGKIQGSYNKAQALNSVAWKLCGEGIDRKPIDSENGKAISAQSLELMRYLIRTLKGRPSYLTPKQWQQSLRSFYGAFQDTYATFLYQAKDYEGAYQHEKEAAAYSPCVYAYSVLTDLIEKVKGRDSAQRELEHYALVGQINSKMKDQLKAIYLSSHTEPEWTTYIEGLEKASKEKIRKAVAAQMIHTPAPAFVLKDIKGNPVDFSSLKGKTVVVDFWATWCGPCKASFPGMQKAVTKYREDSTVVFLFIDTWETAKNREQLVKDFIEKNQYGFRVLYDEAKLNSDDYAVVSHYKVDGIPTKFVIDPKGTIRFKVVGFGGDDEALVEELSTMIELSKN